MDDIFSDLLKFLADDLSRKGYTITNSVLQNPGELPVINGFKPDLVATYKNIKTVYGKVELPDDVFTKDHWDRLNMLSANDSIPLYVAFPEKDKMKLVLSLINGKLNDRQNIIKLYK